MTTVGSGAEQPASLTNIGNASRMFFRVITSPASTVPPGFSLIPAGTFTMGDQSSPLVGNSDETGRTLTLSAYYMGQTEVTYAQWQARRPPMGRAR